MWKIIRNMLLQIINDMDSGNSNITEAEEQELLFLIQKISRQDLSKLEAANYIGVSRATFDKYVKDGLIPKGEKRMGFKELSWKKSDLDNVKHIRK